MLRVKWSFCASPHASWQNTFNLRGRPSCYLIRPDFYHKLLYWLLIVGLCLWLCLGPFRCCHLFSLRSRYLTDPLDPPLCWLLVFSRNRVLFKNYIQSRLLIRKALMVECFRKHADFLLGFVCFHRCLVPSHLCSFYEGTDPSVTRQLLTPFSSFLSYL